VEAEETGDEAILMKDQHGQVIGFEKLNFFLADDYLFGLLLEDEAIAELEAVISG